MRLSVNRLMCVVYCCAVEQSKNFLHVALIPRLTQQNINNLSLLALTVPAWNTVYICLIFHVSDLYQGVRNIVLSVEECQQLSVNPVISLTFMIYLVVMPVKVSLNGKHTQMQMLYGLHKLG